MPMTQTSKPMPGADPDSLLRSTCWAAEKLFKSRGNRFPSVLFLVEYADGKRQRLERLCNNAPAAVSDGDLLVELARDAAQDFAATSVVPDVASDLWSKPEAQTMLQARRSERDHEASSRPQSGASICIELHGDGAHGEAYSARSSARQLATLLLGAPEPLEGSFSESPYAKVVLSSPPNGRQRPKPRLQEAAAKAETAAKVKVKVPIKAKVARAASAWPPQFLLNRPVTPARRAGVNTNSSSVLLHRRGGPACWWLE